MLGWLMSVTLIRWAKLLCCICWMLGAPGLSRRFVDWIWMHRAVGVCGEELEALRGGYPGVRYGDHVLFRHLRYHTNRTDVLLLQRHVQGTLFRHH
jgi:hypothetical protein